MTNQHQEGSSPCEQGDSVLNTSRAAINLTTSNSPSSSDSANNQASIASKYIDPDTVAPVGGASADPKVNPLTLLAQTCSNIGKDLPSSQVQSADNASNSSVNSNLSSGNKPSIMNGTSSRTSPVLQPPPKPVQLHNLKRPLATSPVHPGANNSPPPSTAPNGVTAKQSSASEAVTNALNALGQAVRGNPLAAQHFDLADLVKMNRFAEPNHQQPQGPPAKMAKPMVPAKAEPAHHNNVHPFAAQMLKTTTPLAINNAGNNAPVGNNGTSKTPAGPASASAVATADQQRIYAAYLAQLMRNPGQQGQQQAQPNGVNLQPQHPSPLPPTPPPQNSSGPNPDIWSMVLQSYAAKQQNNGGVDLTSSQKAAPVRHPPRSSTPGMFTCNWLQLGSSLCAKKFSSKEGLLEHISSAHCSTNPTHHQQTAVQQPQQQMPPEGSNVGDGNQNIYQAMFLNYLSSLVPQGGPAKTTFGPAVPSSTVSPTSNSSSSRSENSPIYQHQHMGNPANMSMEQLKSIQQMMLSKQPNVPTPPSPPRNLHLNNNGNNAGAEQMSMFASFLQQMASTPQQTPTANAAPVSAQQIQAILAASNGLRNTSGNAAEVENLFARHQQQQQLQAAVLSAAAAKNAGHRF